MLQNFKDQIKFKLAKILTPEVDKRLKIEERLAVADEKIASVDLYGIAPWYQENFWEPPVQIALQNLCKPGDVVFDVGANFGGLSTLMSRAVGPKGVVCSFEASPRIISKTQRNLVLSGCSNVQLFHNAVYHTSGQTVKIYLGDHLNDSIYQEYGEDSAYEVKTLALDDFIAHTQLVPNLLKMDKELLVFEPGRYIIDVDFTALGTNNALMYGVKTDNKVLFQYNAYSHLLASTYLDWIIDLAETSTITLYFEFQNGTRDESLAVQGVKVNKITNIRSSNYLN